MEVCDASVVFMFGRCDKQMRSCEAEVTTVMRGKLTVRLHVCNGKFCPRDYIRAIYAYPWARRTIRYDRRV